MRGLVRLHAWRRMVNHDGIMQHGRICSAVLSGRTAAWPLPQRGTLRQHACCSDYQPSKHTARSPTDILSSSSRGVPKKRFRWFKKKPGCVLSWTCGGLFHVFCGSLLGWVRGIGVNNDKSEVSKNSGFPGISLSNNQPNKDSSIRRGDS
jgi:hypothetical protein